MKTNLYSARWSTAQGWHWKYERECLPTTANDWLTVFKRDEPEVLFVLSEKTPSKKALLTLERPMIGA